MEGTRMMMEMIESNGKEELRKKKVCGSCCFQPFFWEGSYESLHFGDLGAGWFGAFQTRYDGRRLRRRHFLAYASLPRAMAF